MKLQVELKAREFHYTLGLGPGDRRRARRSFSGVAEDEIQLVRERYRVRLPFVFDRIHPDLHAAAIWYTLRPFIGERLVLPFGVSSAFAATMAAEYGLELSPVDPALAPRKPPRDPRPCLLFSGGMDSVAAALLLPEETVALALDRMGHGKALGAPVDERQLLDLRQLRAVCRRLAETQRDVYLLRDDHERLYTPYPMWHSEMSLLLPLYLADTFDVQCYETGDVFDVFFMGGYHDGAVESWGLKPWVVGLSELGDLWQRAQAARRARSRTLPGEAASGRLDGPRFFAHQAVLGLRKVSSTAGLSEVATTRIVAQSRFRDKTWSCYYPAADGAYCMSCDKCFKKLLLMHICDGRPVPAALFEHFLSQPHLAQILLRPGYWDWHHIWFYIFQRIECDHWFAVELSRQARQGPDLSMLEKWYPVARPMIPAAYRARVEEQIDTRVGTMTRAEMHRLETMRLPTIEAPPLPA